MLDGRWPTDWPAGSLTGKVLQGEKSRVMKSRAKVFEKEILPYSLVKEVEVYSVFMARVPLNLVLSLTHSFIYKFIHSSNNC